LRLDLGHGEPAFAFARSDAEEPVYPGEGSARESCIGTNIKDLRRALGEMLVNARPHVGTYRPAAQGPAHPDLTAVVAVGGWPLFVPEDYRNFIDSNTDRFKSGSLVAVSADTLPSELRLLKEGYVAALVGQRRPFEMGEKSMDALLALHDGKPVQQIIYTGVDRVTKANVGEFMK
jgi:hypothetical protein